MHERNILYIPLGVGILHFQILQMHFLAFFSGKKENTKSTAFVSKMQFERRFKVFAPPLWKTFFFFQLWKEQIQKSPIRTFFMVLLNSLLHALLRYWPTYNALISFLRDKYFSLAGLSPRVQSDAGTSKERGREPKRVANGELKII